MDAESRGVVDVAQFILFLNAGKVLLLLLKMNSHTRRAICMLWSTPLLLVLLVGISAMLLLKYGLLNLVF